MLIPVQREGSTLQSRCVTRGTRPDELEEEPDEDGQHAVITTLRTAPARIMWDCLMWPLPKTMAFGGVATGSANANEAAIAPETERKIAV